MYYYKLYIIIIKATRQRIVASLPDEPEAGDQVAKIRFRLPLGKFLERRFLSSDNLQVHIF